MKVGIVGATGWLGSALGKGLLDKGLVAPADLSLLNRSGPRPDYHGQQVHWARDLDDLVAHAEVIVLSVRPQDWPALDLRADGRLVISFMAGVRCADLAGTGGRIVRAIPNAAAEIGKSFSPWFADEGVGRDDFATVTRVLSAIGSSDALAREEEIDVITAVSGAGPAYPALMAVMLERFMLAQGLSAHIARRAALNVICDAGGLVGADPALTVRRFLDYRGTTAAALDAMCAEGMEAALASGLKAAMRRAAQM